MQLKNLKITTQLKTGLTLIVFLVFLLGIAAFIQSNKLQIQSEEFYEHPFSTKNNIAKLRQSIDVLVLNMHDLVVTKEEQNKTVILSRMKVNLAEAESMFEALKKSYLGQADDIKEAYSCFLQWQTVREETLQQIASGELEKAEKSLHTNGALREKRESLITALSKIENYASSKAIAFQKESMGIYSAMKIRLLAITLMIVLFSFLISQVLLRNIRVPLVELTKTADRLKNGDLTARNSYQSNNEFGNLSNTINLLSENIERIHEQEKKMSALSGLMLNNYEIKPFFRETLQALATYTNSNSAAVYVSDSTKQTFHHFESIGLNQQARQSFSAENLEGEFGAVILKKQIQHIKDIPANARLKFPSVTGTLMPQEILTIPIIAHNEIIAIISLANLGTYTPDAIELVHRILYTLSARIEGIIAANNTLNLSKKLAVQNQELETQKAELSAQSFEFMQQNKLLEVQKIQLNEVSRLKTNFLANMSHELRTPLNSVIALSGVLGRRLTEKIPAEEYSYLNVIERNGKNLLAIINDILDISRIESGKEEIELRKINVNSLITDLIDTLMPQAKQQNIELLQIDFDSKINILTDSHKLRHVLQNIIGNAIKFTEKGFVEVSVLESEKNIIIKIKDTGIGISEDNLPHIFDEFRQADGSTSRKFGGSGLGLAIAKKYATILGGEITVSSTLGKGSQFEVILPIEFNNTENKIIEPEEIVTFHPAALQTPLASTSNASIKTILIIEDSEPAIIQINDLLIGNGYEVMIARSGEEALAITNQRIPDAIILDLMMPIMDGFTVLNRLRSREETYNIPVLILTAKQITKEELTLLKSNHIQQCIQKGDINLSELLFAIKSMVQPEKTEGVVPLKKLHSGIGKPSILVVEDNIDNMITMRALLADHYTLLEAIDGKEGIEQTIKHKPDLVLMDIALPGIDGIEALTEIRSYKELQNIPIVAVTASVLMYNRETILSHGFDDYLPKPVDAKLLTELINKLLYGK